MVVICLNLQASARLFYIGHKLAGTTEHAS